jgi:hypothetical protein
MSDLTAQAPKRDKGRMYRISWFKNPRDGEFIEMRENVGSGVRWYQKLEDAERVAERVLRENDGVIMAHVYDNKSVGAVKIIKR